MIKVISSCYILTIQLVSVIKIDCALPLPVGCQAVNILFWKQLDQNQGFSVFNIWKQRGKDKRDNKVKSTDVRKIG
jgi:hypothetical protein